MPHPQNRSGNYFVRFHPLKARRTDSQVIATADKILMKQVIERSILALEQPPSNL
jgi:hypothetical protein